MEIIYDKHEEEWNKCLNDSERKKISKTWVKNGTLDKWRHKRMLKGIDTLITKTSTWLTLGDGRYGTDANYIIEKGGNAHASDISDKLLKIGNEIGFIKDYSEENAENLSFKDETFDFILIKEAFHHFPRPWIALYESFRVCKKGVILIEPNDINSPSNRFRLRIFNILKNLVKLLFKKKTFSSGYNFEKVGNFIYTINERELEKFLLGMHYRNIAFKKLSDFYLKDAEYINLNSKELKDKIKIQFLKKIILFKELLSTLGFTENDLLCTILFKEEPDLNTLTKLKRSKWILKKLPKNPFI